MKPSMKPSSWGVGRPSHCLCSCTHGPNWHNHTAFRNPIAYNRFQNYYLIQSRVKAVKVTIKVLVFFLMQDVITCGHTHVSKRPPALFRTQNLTDSQSPPRGCNRVRLRTNSSARSSDSRPREPTKGVSRHCMRYARRAPRPGCEVHPLEVPALRLSRSY